MCAACWVPIVIVTATNRVVPLHLHVPLTHMACLQPEVPQGVVAALRFMAHPLREMP